MARGLGTSRRTGGLRGPTNRRAAVALLLVSMGLTTGALPAQAAAVPVPHGFQVMCQDHPAECRGGGASSIHYTTSVQVLLDKVNRRINASIIPVKNEVIDVWTINARRGDCEEYVLSKRHALIASGVPASALSIVYALRNGGGHAILAVHTDKGDFALDNMTSRIKPLWHTGYHLISMSGPNPRVWRWAGSPRLASRPASNPLAKG